MWKSGNIFMLPTHKKTSSCIMLGAVPNHCVLTKDVINDTSDWMNYGKPQHLYVTFNDEVQVGDFVIVNLDNVHLAKILKIDVVNNMFDVELFDFNGAKIKVFKSEIEKIISTTDSSLKECICECSNDWATDEDHGYIQLLQPSQLFIEKYVEEYNKGNVITDVLVEYETKQHFEAVKSKRKDTLNGIWYENILKVNTNDNTINIKQTKDSWSRDEVIEKIRDMYLDIVHGNYNKGLNKWIEENI